MSCTTADQGGHSAGYGKQEEPSRQASRARKTVAPPVERAPGWGINAQSGRPCRPGGLACSNACSHCFIAGGSST